MQQQRCVCVAAAYLYGAARYSVKTGGWELADEGGWCGKGGGMNLG